MTALPDTLRVGQYGVALLTAARLQAVALMLYILSPAGQRGLSCTGSVQSVCRLADQRRWNGKIVFWTESTWRST